MLTRPPAGFIPSRPIWGQPPDDLDAGGVAQKRARSTRKAPSTIAVTPSFSRYG